MPLSTSRAFTLIELVVVIAILGAMTAVAALSVRQPLQLAESELLLEQIRSLDASARERSKRREEVSIRLDLRRRQFALVDERKNTRLIAIPIPPSVRLASTQGFRTTDGTDQTLHIPYSRYGTSPTFGFSLSISSKRQQWIAFLGLTGQLEKFSSRGSFDAVLRVQ